MLFLMIKTRLVWPLLFAVLLVNIAAAQGQLSERGGGKIFFEDDLNRGEIFDRVISNENANSNLSDEALRELYAQLSERLYDSDVRSNTEKQSNGLLVQQGSCSQPFCKPKNLEGNTSRALSGVLVRNIHVNQGIRGLENTNLTSSGALKIEWDQPALNDREKSQWELSAYTVVVSNADGYLVYEIKDSTTHGLPVRNRGRGDQIAGGLFPAAGSSNVPGVNNHTDTKAVSNYIYIPELGPGRYSISVTPQYVARDEAVKNEGSHSVEREALGSEVSSMVELEEVTIGSITFASKALQQCVYQAVNNELDRSVDELINLSCVNQGV